MSFVFLPLIVPVFSSKYTEFFFVVNKVLQTVFVTISLFYKYYQPAKEMSFKKKIHITFEIKIPVSDFYIFCVVHFKNQEWRSL